MPLNKVLWGIDIDPTALLQHAQTCRAQVVCIRTTNSHLRNAIAQFHQHGIKVYGWRWPAVKADTHSPHHFASDEANFVVQQLIPAGLDGYIVPLQKEQLEKAPRYAQTSMPEYTDEYGRKVYDYYGVSWQ